MKKNQFLIFLLFFTSTLVLAQTGLKSILAERYYSKYAYVDAIPFYEDLSLREQKNTEYLSKLCDCYRLTGNTQKAESCYSRLDTMQGVDPINYFYYAQVLEENEKYTDAQKFYKLYSEKNTADSRSNRKLESGKTPEIWKTSTQYNVINCDFNSSNADFGMFPFTDSSFMFTTNRPSEISEKHTYIRDKQPFLDLYTTSKIKKEAFSSPQKLSKAVNSPYHEGPVFYDRSSKTYYVTRNNYYEGKYHKSRDGVNKLKLYILKLDGSKWGKYSEFEYNDDEYSVGHAAISMDGDRLYFSSDMPGGYGLADIYVSFKEGDKWGKPQNLGSEINTEGNEMFPYVSADGKLYFSSDGNYGLGGLDIYSSEIKKEKVSNIKNLGAPINSNKDDFSFYVNTDNATGYFSSNRVGGKGSDDIYAFTFTKERYFVSGKAIDKITGTILPKTAVKLTDENGTIISEIITSEDGSYKFEIESEKTYTLKGAKESYWDGVATVSTKGANAKITEINADVPLEKDPGLFIYGIILDKVTKTPLEDVNVLITEEKTNAEIINLKTPVSGDFKKTLEDKKLHDTLSYSIKIDKRGYLTKTVPFKTEITNLGEIKLQEAMDIALDKIEIGTEIGKLIDIKPVYFDVSKWDIRLDAAIELNKIVKVMNENPTLEIELGSHTDCRSSANKNMGLSDKRAKASAEYISQRITNPERIAGKGYGESQPVNKCECEGSKVVPCTDAEHQANRRAEFKVVKY